MYKDNYGEIDYLDNRKVFPKWCDTGKNDENKKIHEIVPEGIIWKTSEYIDHYDHIEMSGRSISTICSYGVSKDKELLMHQHIVVPGVRTIPNDTHGSFSFNFSSENIPNLIVNEIEESLKVDSIIINDGLEIRGNNGYINHRLKLVPTIDKKIILERHTLKNNTPKCIKLEVPRFEVSEMIDSNRLVRKGFSLEVKLLNSGIFNLDSNEEITYYVQYEVYNENPEKLDLEVEFSKRYDFINRLDNELVVSSGIESFDKMIEFAKHRLCESIYDTPNGLMHSPGGGSYYSALWTNDQCEYANPVFSYIDYKPGIEQSINGYNLFKRYMNFDYSYPLVSSIVAEGEGFWAGAGDRGDAAMYAYGASRFVLQQNNVDITTQLWPAIKWCIKYCESKIDPKHGVIKSDSDELEGRFPTGEANLTTSTLLYDSYISANYIAKAFDEKNNYIDKANKLKSSIENFFGSKVEGFDTYKYYEDNTCLRAWISIPLVVGIEERAEETVKALISDKLWTKNGLKSSSEDNKTFWDRATLYAIRAMFYNGFVDEATEKLEEYSTKRLLGNHVPYAIEAYPEGNQKHLSAESALYIKILIEGVLGLRPKTFGEYEAKINLPTKSNKLFVENIMLSNQKFSIDISSIGDEKYCFKLINDDGEIQQYINKRNEKFNIKL